MEELVLQFKSLKSNVKPILLPVIILSVVVILSILSAPTVYDRVTDSLEQLDNSSAKSEQLRQKSLSLRDIQTNILPQTSNAVLALPRENPGLYKYNVIRSNNQSVEEITIEELKTDFSKIKDSDINSMTMEVTYSNGNLDQLTNMLDKIMQTVPYTTINKFSYSKDDGIEYTVGYTVHWSELPKTIAKISDPVNALTADEIETLSLISQLGKPDFVDLEQTSYPERTSPFQ